MVRYPWQELERLDRGKPWRGLGNGNGNVNVPAHHQVVDAIPKAAEVDRGISGEAALLYLDFDDGVTVGLRGSDRDGKEQNGGDGDEGDTDPVVG